MSSALALALTALLSSSQQATKTPIARWLLFPVDVSRYEKFSSRFGPRTFRRHSSRHSGIDLQAPSGTVVVAAREGTVREISYDRRAGWFIKIEHPQGWSTVYCHLREDPRKRGLRAGMWVRAAQSIALVGNTGRSSGPHLHFGLITSDGRHVDPVPHLLTPLETYRILYPTR